MTQATIGYKKADGTFRVVYCHNDSNPKITAQILAEHYDTVNKVEQLICKGNLFMVVPEVAHVVHFVDRGMDAAIVAPTVVASESELLARHQHKHFYLFADGVWSMHIREEHMKYEWHAVDATCATA